MMPRSIERDNATKPASCLHDALQHPVKLSMRTAESDGCPLSTMRSAFESKSKATSVGILAIQIYGILAIEQGDVRRHIAIHGRL